MGSVFQAHCINTAKILIFNAVILADNVYVSMGEHPLVKIFLKGIYNTTICVGLGCVIGIKLV